MKRFVDYIPHLSERDRVIIGHLLHHNQRVFTNVQDCGHASVLYAMGFVQMIARPGQVIDYWDFPFGVPDPVWDAMVEHKDQFPYKQPEGERRGRDGAPPWRQAVM